VGWKEAYDGCGSFNGASVAWWTHWKELKFYYNAFNLLNQTLVK